jgi:hypothetical protein
VAGELARELSQFPFTKLRPRNFRVEIAGLTERERETCPVKIWVETEDIAKIVKIAGAARIIRAYPHLNFVYLETYASQLASLVRSELVRSVWNDEPVKADGCIVVTRADPGAFSLASRVLRGTC